MKKSRRGFLISLLVTGVSLIVFLSSLIIGAINSGSDSGDVSLGSIDDNSALDGIPEPSVPQSTPPSDGVDSSVMIAAISGVTTICTTYITVRFNKKAATPEKEIVYVRVDENGKDIGEKANKD